MNATLHKGKTWWIIPDGAKGFNQMRHGFQSRESAIEWATANGFTLRELTK